MSEGSKLMNGIYEHFGADIESRKVDTRWFISKLRNKDLITKLSDTPRYVLTEEGKRILECLRLMEGQRRGSEHPRG